MKLIISNYIDLSAIKQYKHIIKFTKILFYHNFNNMISEKELVDFIELSQEKTKIVNVIYKFAVMVENLDSAKNFMQLISKYSNEYSLIGIIMGEIGLYSRVFGDLFGSKMTYCTLTEPKAPGQIQPKTLVNLRNKKLEEFSKNPLEYHDIKNLIV